MQGLLLTGLLLLAVAALHDVLVRTVPNWSAAGLLAIGISVQAIQGSLLHGLIGAGLVFAAAILLWRRGWMGGGDVKLLGASALLVPPLSIPSLILAVSVAGTVLALPYLLARRRLTVPAMPAERAFIGRLIRVERWRMRRGGPLPYAVAIAGGAAVVVVNGGLS